MEKVGYYSDNTNNAHNVHLAKLNHLIYRRTMHADWRNKKQMNYYDRHIRQLCQGYPFLMHIIKDGLRAHVDHDPQY